MAVAPGRGRKPKPTAKKELAGNPGRRPLNLAEPDFSEVTEITPPDWMPERAQAMWQAMVPELLREKILCITDLHNVEAFCVAYDKWRMSEEAVQEHGILITTESGTVIKNPALTAANEAMRQLSTFGAQLGLDPSSRSRLIGGGKKSPDNPFKDLI